MVTEQGDAKSRTPDGDDIPGRPRIQRIAIPNPLHGINTPLPSPRDGSTTSQYVAYSPAISQAYHPQSARPASPRHPRPQFPLRSPSFPIVNTQDLDPQSPHTADTDERAFMTSPTSSLRHDALKLSASATNLRAQQRSPFRPDQLRSSPSPHSPSLPRFVHHHHYIPELHFEEPPRSSLQSAITASSLEPASGTERSSVVTKTSSLTDLSPDTSDYDGGMSVDDAISMYLDGFTDDPPLDISEEPKPDDHVNNIEDRRRYYEPRETMKSDTDDKEITTMQNDMEAEEVPEEVPADDPIQPDTPKQQSLFPPGLPGIVPPQLLNARGDRDRYGFRKTSHHITGDQYAAWTEPYWTYMGGRKQKWHEMLKELGLDLVNPVTFPPRSAKVKRYIRKGIPPEYRGPAWFWYAGGYPYMHKNPGLYQRLVDATLKGPTNDDKEHIERDLHRTFPDNIHFKPDINPDANAQSDSGSSNMKYRTEAPESALIQALRRVLYAFSMHNPKIGYTQSLNFIAGLLLLFLPEEKAFWMLHIITSTYLPGTHEISLEGANVDLWILMVLLKETLPSVYTKVVSTTPTTSRTRPPVITTKTRLPDITLGMTNWLMSFFIGTLPLETTLRVWDILFYEGSRTFFKTSLAIFRSGEKDILSLSDPMEIFQAVQAAPKKLLDANTLVDGLFTRRFRLTQSRVDELRAARRSAIREEKERISIFASLGNVDEVRPSTSANNNSPAGGAWKSLKNHAFK
ncbi:hypothetical protein AJ80_08243 [Polytolypa hystricis UAMH7299]|uniref:Rab-GAP TBC domain-containing protein n=1 Tax=Polytolypa hystricis (strain UAMH7299) TaxID=1447883 RepID=A0A2B7XAR4_POLH7|nr:hypothetical protein AJ80_08243 [Polytolypa hystricis UAMH7299]